MATRKGRCVCVGGGGGVGHDEIVRGGGRRRGGRRGGGVWGEGGEGGEGFVAGEHGAGVCARCFRSVNRALIER